MHTAESALPRIVGYVALHHSWIQAMGLEFAKTVAPREEAAIVLVLLNVDQICTLKFGLGEDHNSEQ